MLSRSPYSRGAEDHLSAFRYGSQCRSCQPYRRAGDNQFSIPSLEESDPLPRLGKIIMVAAEVNAVRIQPDRRIYDRAPVLGILDIMPPSLVMGRFAAQLRARSRKRSSGCRPSCRSVSMHVPAIGIQIHAGFIERVEKDDRSSIRCPARPFLTRLRSCNDRSNDSARVVASLAAFHKRFGHVRSRLPVPGCHRHRLP